MTAEPLFFFVLAAFAITTALLTIRQRNPVMSAIFLVGNFFCLAGLYLLLRAQLLAVMQIVVYTGAIMVLVVFVIMLLNLGNEQRLTERFSLRMSVGAVLGFGLLLELLAILIGLGSENSSALHPQAEAIGSVEGIGTALFGKFLLPFEVTSLLLLAAIVGAVVLAKKRD
jgi:NADH-quinone oxidoreductase subunit J